LGAASAHLEDRGQLPLSQFTCEAGPDRSRCPQGHYLPLHQHKPEARAKVYWIEDAAWCAACPQRAQCPSAKGGRSLQRHVQAEIIAQAQKEARSPAARSSRKRRKPVREGRIADAANNHGSKRARWRGLWRPQLQGWLICACQNLRRLVKHRCKPPLLVAGAGTVLASLAMLAQRALGSGKPVAKVTVAVDSWPGFWIFPHQSPSRLIPPRSSLLKA
jgi:hypothetical protein